MLDYFERRGIPARKKESMGKGSFEPFLVFKMLKRPK